MVMFSTSPFFRLVLLQNPKMDKLFLQASSSFISLTLCLLSPHDSWLCLSALAEFENTYCVGLIQKHLSFVWVMYLCVFFFSTQLYVFIFLFLGQIRHLSTGLAQPHRHINRMLASIRSSPAPMYQRGDGLLDCRDIPNIIIIQAHFNDETYTRRPRAVSAAYTHYKRGKQTL